VGVGPDHRGPLEKHLVAAVGFVFAHPVVGVSKLQAQPIELAHVPGNERRVADGFLPRAGDARRVIEEKAGGPVLVELQLRIAVAAIGLTALRKRNVVSGTCTPQRDTPRNTPRCPVNVPGYIVRASDILRVSTDTVEIYYSAERFGAATGQRPEALRFEKIYQLVGSGTSWRVAREARVREPERKPTQ